MLGRDGGESRCQLICLHLDINGASSALTQTTLI